MIRLTWRQFRVDAIVSFAFLAVVKLGPNLFGGLAMTPTHVEPVPQNPSIPNAWVRSTTLADKAGNPPSSAFLNKACPSLASRPSHFAQGLHGVATKGVPSPFALKDALEHCVSAIAARFHAVVTYQPGSRYWPFQAYETALFVVLALVLAGVSYWWVRRRLTAG